MDKKKFRRYKIAVWVFIITIIAAYVNGIWDIIKFIITK